MNYKYMQKPDKRSQPSFNYANAVIGKVDYEEVRRNNTFIDIKKKAQESKIEEVNKPEEEEENNREKDRRTSTGKSKSKSKSRSKSINKEPVKNIMLEDELRSFEKQDIRGKERNSEHDDFILLKKEMMGENIVKKSMAREPVAIVRKSYNKKKTKAKESLMDTFNDDDYDDESKKIEARLLKKKNPKSLSQQEKKLLKSFKKKR